MVYCSKLAAAIKVNGKVLRETDNTVSLPFGSEYSIYIKNLNSVRVQVKVSVDGTNTTGDAWIIIQPNSHVELQRFVRNGNWNSGNAFKFIERTEVIEEHRGIKAEDGLIRIEYQTERVEVPDVHRHHIYEDNYPFPHLPKYPKYPQPWNPKYFGTLHNNTRTVTMQADCRATKSSMGGVLRNRSDAGITVPGSVNHQQFYAVASFPVHKQSEIIILKLRGEVSGKKVTKVITSKSKICCLTCGKSNRSSNKFCSQCGAALELI